MREEITGNWRPALRQAMEDFSAGEPQLMAECSGTVYLAAERTFVVPYRGNNYHVIYPGGEVHMELAGTAVPASDRILLLRYLYHASGLPLRGHWLTFLELPNGPHHYAPFCKEAIAPLTRKFGNNPCGLLEAAKPLAGKSMPAGDCGVEIPVLPKLPLGVIVWAGDEEFSPRANIVFDSSASTYLDTASLYVLGINLAIMLCK